MFLYNENMTYYGDIPADILATATESPMFKDAVMATPLEAAQTELDAATAAMNAPTCTQGPATGLPAHICHPELSKAVADAAQRVAELQKGNKTKYIIAAAVLVAAIGGYFWWQNRG